MTSRSLTYRPLGRRYGILALLVTIGATASTATAVARPLGRTATVASSPMPVPGAVVCKRLRQHFGALSLSKGRHHLTVLATGDSMIYPISEELEIGHPPGWHVVTSRHDGTGLTTNTVNWHALARRQVARFRPGATVITLGGRDGGIPLQDANGHLVDCCGTEWLSLYAADLRPLALDYLRGGSGQLYWLMIPAPREQARAPLYEAVDDAIRLLATEIGPPMHVIPVDAVVSPGGFQNTITYEGMTIAPRAPDGIHLTHAGACVERSLVVEAMLADGLLRPASP